MMDAASLLALFSLIGLLEANVCPSEEDISPCECSFRSNGIDVECTDIRKPEELIPPMRALKRSNTEVWKLIIKDTSLLYLADNLFKNVNIRKVTLENMNITSLSDTQTAFYGLENSLTHITAKSVAFTSGFRFDQFRNLERLDQIDFNRCDMQAVIHHLPYLPSLLQLEITRSKISFIPSKAFRDLPVLAIIELTDNDITAMKRSMFPNPANHLARIDLSYNRLSSLPNDFFENMPILKHVYLEENKFKILAEKPFSDALKNGILGTFEMSGNPLHCDCTLSWLGAMRLPKEFSATCSSPEVHKEKSVKILDFESLRLEKCYDN